MNTKLDVPIQTEMSPRMRFQLRDEEILNAIYRYGGLLAKRQLKELFWPGKTWRSMEKRLSKLYRGEYLDWPSREQWRSHPVPEPVCWLGWKGAALLARELGANVGHLHAGNENQQRKLAQSLRRSGLHWMREPRWIQLKHDLSVVDFRMMIEKSVKQQPSLSMAEWILEREFRADPDVIEYEVQGRGGQRKKVRRAMIPDGFFSIRNNDRLIEGKPLTARFLIEVDMSTEDNPRFARDKIRPSIAYLRSARYQDRFGYKSGRWLVIANSDLRLKNLRQQAELVLSKDAAIFYFTTFEGLASADALSAPIWYRGGEKLLRPLLDM